MSAKRKKTLWSILIGATSVCAVLGFAGSRKFNVRPAITQLQAARGPIQNVRFTVYDAGIFPPVQRATPGNVAVSIEDRTHRSSGLVVQAQANDAALTIGQVPIVVREARGRAQLSLGVGHYSVFDPSQPDKRAELVIEP